MDPHPLPGLTAEVVWESSPDGMVLVDADGILRWANSEAERMFGRTASGLLGQPVEELVPPDSAEQHRRHRDGYAEAPRRRPMGTGLRLEGSRADGTSFPVQVALSPLRLGGASYTIAAVRDVSDWVAAEDELNIAVRRRELAEDHERIGRELHDTVIQELFAVGMGLQALVGQIDGQPADRIDQAINAIDEIIRSIRAVVFDVSRQLNPDVGVRASVVGLVGDLAATLGFEPVVRFRGPVDAAVPASVAEQLLPTLREALTNVARHAGATSVEVDIIVDDACCLTVYDNGRGIEEPTGEGHGLVNLARRAALLGGAMRIEGDHRGGTNLEWEVPLQP